MIPDELQAAAEHREYQAAKTRVRWFVRAMSDDERGNRILAGALTHLPGPTGTVSRQCRECGHDWPCVTYVVLTGEGEM